MDASRYAALFGPKDEEEVEVPSPFGLPPLAPTGGEMPFEVRVPPEAPVEAAAEGPSAEEVVKSHILGNRKFSTLGEAYDIPMGDATPQPRTANPNALLSGLTRAASTLTSGIAGVKPDTSFADGIQKDGDNQAIRQDKANDDLTNFKQQLLAKVVGDREVKRGSYDSGLNDPNSAAYKNMLARFQSDDTSKRFLERAQMNAKIQGLPHLDLNTIKELKPGQAISATGASDRASTAEANKFTRMEDAQNHSKEMAGLQFNYAVQKMDYGDALKVLGEERHATNPGRDFKRDASGNQVGAPTAEMAKLVLVNDAGSRKVKMLTEKLLMAVRASNPVDAANPASPVRMVLAQIHQDLLNQVRVLENFGVPSGKDMEQLARSVQDPTWFRNIVTGREFGALEQLIQSNDEKADIYADTFGYGRMGTAPATPTPQAQRTNAKAEIGLGAGPEVVAPPPPAPTGKVTPSGNPYAKKQMDPKTGAVRYVDAAGNVVP